MVVMKEKGKPHTKDTAKSKDRHKPRKMIAIDPKVHAAIVALAKANRRPVTWEIEGILIEALKIAGYWKGGES